MPHKFDEPRRHKIPRTRHRIRSWSEYDRALQRRGDLTVWITPEAIAAWCPPRTGGRGRPRDYSDVAIELRNRDCRKVGGQAAVATDGCRSLAA